MRQHLPKILTVLGITLVFALAIVFYLDWRIPRATATVQLHPAMVVIKPINSDSKSTHPFFGRWYVESPTHKFVSAETLRLASQRVGLKMSDEENVRLLKKITTITPHEGTDFIDIIVKHSPREEAIRLANAIAQVGVERGATIQKNRAQRAIDALDEELTNQRTEVADHLSDLKFLMTEYKVPFPSDQKSFPLPKDLPTEPNTDVIDLSIRQHIYIQAKETYEQSQAMLNEMKIKQQETRTLLKMPRTPVTIHKHAQ